MLKGIVPALITPTQNQHVSVDRLKQYTNWLVSAGVDGLFAHGTTGEGLLIPIDEWEVSLSAIMKAVKGQIPVVVQCGGISWHDTIWRIEAAVRQNVAGVAIVTPFYYSYEENQLEQYFADLLSSWPSLKFYLYNIPKYAGNQIEPSLYRRLADAHANLLGVKDSSGSVESVKMYIAAAPRLSVLSGSDSTIEKVYEAGAVGVVTGVGAAFPRLLLKAWEGLLTGDGHVAELVKQVTGVFHKTSTIQALRAVLNKLGVPVGDPFRPLPIMSEIAQTELLADLNQLGVL